MDVDPSHLVGNGLRKLVRVLDPPHHSPSASEDGLSNLALSLESVSDVTDPRSREFAVTGLRAARAFLCGVQGPEGPQADLAWVQFRSGRPPTDVARQQRQEAAARLGLVATALHFVGSVDGAVAQEAILLLESLLHGETWNSGLQMVQERALEHFASRKSRFLPVAMDLILKLIEVGPPPPGGRCMGDGVSNAISTSTGTHMEQVTDQSARPHAGLGAENHHRRCRRQTQ